MVKETRPGLVNVSGICSQLSDQYPEGTGFVILPMDMQYMEAGKIRKLKNRKDPKGGRLDPYARQMEVLASMKKHPRYKDRFYPFVFVDPRREEVIEKIFFKYRIDNGKVILEDCFIKDYIEDHKFNGFKIYPALGYYPFDETLLPLWKYAADNRIPVMTHSCRGVIYYRGKKKHEWDTHPIFEGSRGNKKYGPLRLMETKNSEFTNNFTHPLNYLCLLEEKLLRKVVGKSSNDNVRNLFGYSNPETPLKHNLEQLKLCFGHFGGDDEWTKFLDSDRDQYSKQMVKRPNHGVTFLTNLQGVNKQGKIEQLWRFTDWYTIICSIMLQYPNVYADLSFILKTTEIQPLLNQTLINYPELSNKVLFGTDFYVVRHHKSDKQMLAEVRDELTINQFDQIARENPMKFLFNYP
ncbi:MAG: hypothetical protein HQ565_12150 [Bacteroidetes bacterium]|nr:hypothetical protein [Bacteroidota bacterium]